jgi:hypothetical protein
LNYKSHTKNEIIFNDSFHFNIQNINIDLIKTFNMNSLIRFIITFSLLVSYSKSYTENINGNTRQGYIENKGQIIDQNNKLNPDVKYLFNSNGLNIQLKANGFSYDTYTIEKNPLSKTNAINPLADKFQIPEEDLIYHFHRVDIEFIGSNINPQIITEQPSTYYYNYYTTGTTEAGVLNVRTFQVVTYKNIYKGIDLQFIVDNNKPKFNFIIHADADIAQIRWKYNGAINTSLTDGKIILQLAQSNLEERIPESFIQETTEKVNVNYVLFGANEFGFTASSFNKNLTLIIDPAPWSTYFGGSGTDLGTAITIDTVGNVLVAGITNSSSNIASSGAQQTTYGGTPQDAFIAKFNSIGSLQWASYYGGSGSDAAYGIATDAGGNAFITGITGSTTGISTTGAYQTSIGSTTAVDAFIVKFNSMGVRQWGTYYGGTDTENASAIAIDLNGNIFVTGITLSSSSIASSGAFQTTYGNSSDAFVAKFNSMGVRQWGTYYGGTGTEQGFGITSDLNGNCIIIGYTNSTSGITTTGAHQTSYGGGSTDAFVAKFNSMGVRQWGTYYGGSSVDQGLGVATDTLGNILITGMTSSVAGIASSGAHQTVFGGTFDAFIVKFNTAGTRTWGTYYGVDLDDRGNCVTTDLNGNLFVAGRTNSGTGMQYGSCFQSSCGGSTDAFIVKFTSSGTIQWATYFGGIHEEGAPGIALSLNGNIFIPGSTDSAFTFATTGTYQTTYGGGTYDAYIASFNSSGTLPVQLTSFNVNLRNNKEVICTWQTASEVNNDYFEIQRSVDGSQFTAIGKVKGNGTSNMVNSYQFTDNNLQHLTSNIYYRLKQVDFDGKSTLSEIRVVNNIQTKNTDWNIYPNPATNELHIETIGNEKLTAQVFDITGKQILENILFTSSTTINISSLHEGMYFVRITVADGVVVKIQKVAVVR